MKYLNSFESPYVDKKTPEKKFCYFGNNFFYFVLNNYLNIFFFIDLLKYLNTKFVRFLLLQALTSIMITNVMFQFVPLQDFTPQSDIDWTKSIADIDKQLYAKYSLTEDEISFIESMIKPME
mgnify:CR=1 FL=1